MGLLASIARVQTRGVTDIILDSTGFPTVLTVDRLSNKLLGFPTAVDILSLCFHLQGAKRANHKMVD